MPATPAVVVIDNDVHSRDYSRFSQSKMPKKGPYGAEVGARIRQRREALGMQQKDVADLCIEVAARMQAEEQAIVDAHIGEVHHEWEANNAAFARVAYTNYENGNVIPGPEKIFCLAEILQTTAKWLYFGDEPGALTSVGVPQSEFKSGRWQDSDKVWSMNRDWLMATFKDVNPQAIACALIEHSESPVLFRGDIAIVDTDVKPSEKPDDFIYSSAGSVHCGEVIKVAGGYDLRAKSGKDSLGIVSAHNVRFLGRLIGSTATLLEPAD